MALEPVKDFFAKIGEEYKVSEYEQSSATVELAAKAIGCEPARIAKSLTFFVLGKPILVVVSGDAKVDNAKFKNEFLVKAKMIPFDLVEENIGHAPGGVCPFAIKDSVEVFLDASLKRFNAVYPAAGSSNACIKLTLDELEKFSGAKKWVDVCKLPAEDIE